MRNIYSATNWLSEVVRMGLPSDKYTAVRLRSFYQAGVKKGLDPDAALSYAKERLRANIDKSVMKPEVNQVKEFGTKEENVSEDELLDSTTPTTNKKLRAIVMRKIADIVGSDEAEINKAYSIYKRVKAQSRLTNREALEEVARITKKHSDYKSRSSDVPVTEENVSEVSSDSFKDTSEDYKLYDLVRNLDPENSAYNLQLFRKYRGQGYRVISALDRIRKIIELRKFAVSEGISLSLVGMLLSTYDDVDEIKRILLEHKRSGKFGMDVEVLSNEIEGVSDNPVVDYNGRKIKLKRLIYNLFRDNYTAREVKTLYSTVKHQIFNYNRTLDEALEFGRRTIRVYRLRDKFRELFPEDPDVAIEVFEEHYVSDMMSYEDAYNLTVQELGGNRFSSSRAMRLAFIVEKRGMFKLSDLLFDALGRK